MTGEKERQHGSSKSSYKIYSPRPSFEGQAPVLRPPPALNPRGSRQLPLGHRHSPALHKRDQGDGRPRRPPGKRILCTWASRAFVQVHADRRHGRHVVRENLGQAARRARGKRRGCPARHLHHVREGARGRRARTSLTREICHFKRIVEASRLATARSQRDPSSSRSRRFNRWSGTRALPSPPSARRASRVDPSGS